MTRRTKIVATLGPSSSDRATLADMVRAGMNVARISLAHTSLDDALALHRLAREVAADEGATLATMVDLPGPIIRIGRPPEEHVDLETGATITLRTGNGPTDHDTVFIDYPDLFTDIAVDDEIQLGESARARVTLVADDHACAEVVFDGSLTGRGAVKLPRETSPLPVATDRVFHEIERFVEAGVDIVTASARGADDLRQLGMSGGDGPMLIAKVESMSAFEHLSEMMPFVRGIIIGRGGLGLEARLEDLPHIQKQITEQCIASGLPVITASQMLDSMITAPAPTRAETTDVSNAILDGASALMLSAETAVGTDPALVVRTLARIAERTDERFDHRGWTRRIAEMRMADSEATDDVAITDAMTIGAARSAEDLGIGKLLCITTSGFTARSMARFRPRADIIAVTPREQTVRQLASSWGVTPVLYQPTTTLYVPRVEQALTAAKQAGLLESGELVGVVTGVTASRGATDTFRILRAP